MSAIIKPQQQVFQTIPDDDADESNRNINYQMQSQSQSQIPSLPPIQPVNTLNSASTVINANNTNNNPVVIANNSITDEVASSQQVDTVEQIQIVPINVEKAPIEVKTEPHNHVHSQPTQQQQPQQVIMAQTYEPKVKPVLRNESLTNRHSHVHSRNHPHYHHHHHHHKHDRIPYEPSYVYHETRPTNPTRSRYAANQDLVLYDPRDRIYEDRYERLPVRVESRSRNVFYDSSISSLSALTQSFENQPKVIPYPVPVMVNNPYMMSYPMSAYPPMMPNTQIPQMPLIYPPSQMPVQQQTTTTATQSNPQQQQTQQPLQSPTKEQTNDEPKQSPRFIYNIHYSPATSKPKVIETNYQIIKRKKPKQLVLYK